LKEEKFKVLKMLVESTSRMDLNMLAQKVSLTPDQTVHLIQELAKEGFLQKVGGGYGVTQKGKTVLKAFTPVQKDAGFHFYFGINQPSNFTAESLEQFYSFIKQISAESLEFHLYRGDFENWLKEACNDPELASEIGGIKAAGLKGEDLRKELLKVFNAKFGIEELL